MTSTAYPFDPHDWTTISPLFASLTSQPVSQSNFMDWLKQWNALDIDVWDAYTQLKRPAYFDVTNYEAENVYQRYVQELYSTYLGHTNSLISRALSLQPDAPTLLYQQLWRRWRNQKDVFHPDSLPIQAEISQLEGSYREIMRQYVWDAENPSGYWLDRRGELNYLFLRLLQLRRKLAQLCGFSTFLEYRWHELNRLDYSLADCRAFHAAVEKMVPVLAEFRSRGIPDQHYPQIEDTAALTAGVERILRQVDPEYGEIFHAMRDDYLDLGNRPNKAGAIEAWFFPRTGMPYIHVASGNPGSVLHESGHAIHEYLSFQSQHSLWNSSSPEEFQEFVATSVDMLAWDYYDQAKGGVYSAQETAAAHKSVRQMYLRLTESVLEDAFEHWVYGEAPENVMAADLDAKWLEFKQRFEPWDNNYSSHDEKLTGWQRWNWSLYRMPLYMIAYPLASVGSFQMERLVRVDRVTVIENFKEAMKRGKTATLPQLFGIVGIVFPFTAKMVEEAIRCWIDAVVERITPEEKT